MEIKTQLDVQLGVLYYYITDEKFRYSYYRYLKPSFFLDKKLQSLYILANKLIKKHNEITFDDLIVCVKNRIKDEDKQHEYLLIIDKIKNNSLSQNFIAEEIKACYVNTQLENLLDELITIDDPFKKLSFLRTRSFQLYNEINEETEEIVTKDRLQDILLAGLKPANILFPIDKMNECLGGISAGDLGVVAGYTSVGKTWFLLGSFVKSVLEGRNIIFITLEMTIEQIIPRLAMFLTKKPWIQSTTINYFHPYFETVQTEVFNDTIIDNLDDTVDKLEAFLMKTKIIEPPGGFSVSDIENEICKYEYLTEKPVDGVIIDGLECINVPYLRNKDAWQITAHAVKDLKTLARVKKIGILTMSQVQKTKETKSLIRLKDIAGGAEIARASSIVITLNQTEDEYIAKCMRAFVAKQREGKLKNTTFVFNSLFSVGMFKNCKIIQDNQVWLDTLSSICEIEDNKEALSGDDIAFTFGADEDTTDSFDEDEEEL